MSSHLVQVACPVCASARSSEKRSVVAGVNAIQPAPRGDGRVSVVRSAAPATGASSATSSRSGPSTANTRSRTASSTTSQLLQTPVGTVSLFGFKTPIPYPFGVERTGYLVTDLDQALRHLAGDAEAHVGLDPGFHRPDKAARGGFRLIMGGCNEHRSRGGWVICDLVVATGQRDRQEG